MICNAELPRARANRRCATAEGSPAGAYGPRCRRRGFTLLEVLVALAVLAITLVTLYQAFSSSLVIHTSNRGLWRAMLYVNDELLRWERMDNPPLHVNQGEFDEDHEMYGYRWLREISAENPIPGVTVRKVSLRLFWNEGAREQTYQSTVYVVPTP